MRISDWSSDVCSSDLSLSETIHMLDNLTQRLSRVVKTMRGEARLTEANTQDMLREVRMALLEADVALPVVRDFVARVKEHALRSEEHTSELQSLMRISYAVFCLKKKNRNTKHRK